MKYLWPVVAFTLALPALTLAADVSDLANRIKAIGPEGAGNTEAAAAWKGAGLDFSKHALAVTGQGSELSRFAVENNWLRQFLERGPISANSPPA